MSVKREEPISNFFRLFENNFKYFHTNKKKNDEVTLELKQFIESLISSSEVEPVFVDRDLVPNTDCNREQIVSFIFSRYPPDSWMFKGYIYKMDKEHLLSRNLYTKKEIKLMILELYDKERKKMEKLKQLYETSPDESAGSQRLRIPERVRIEVWRRDDGKCVRCGSRVNLEYDHIVPISKGGSNTTRNIELLCEKCNREKNNNIM